jgi:hypothetical protein
MINLSFGSRYAFNNIPNDLKIGANAVYRTEELLYTVLGPNKATLKYKVAITLLNETAEGYRYPSIDYNKFSRVNSIKASVYDKNGKLVKILGSSEILDISAISGGTFHSDARMKIFRFPVMKYPYTVEYEYEKTLSGLINYPTWDFQKSLSASVERSGIQYVVPKNIKVKFREKRIPVKADSISVENNTIYTWLMENIPASKANPYGLSTEYTPMLYASPIEFEIEGYKGSTRSWKEFGLWNLKMIQGRDILPESEVKKVQELVKEIDNDREKIKKIYEYMQSRTRYVSIQLGIGGWQPMTATEVSKKGYGDCKALTNYTLALLKAVGINSYYTLVRAGEGLDISKSFVSNQFDHIILCVPQPKDTIWLECTSQVLPFNHLSSFTSNRYVLLITENGGVLVKTPAFSQQENIVKKQGVVNINKITNITQATIGTTYSGQYFKGAQDAFTFQSEKGIKKQLANSLSLPTFEVEKASFSTNKSEYPNAMLDYELTIRNFAVQSANRLYFTPSISKQGFILNEPFPVEIGEYVTFVDSFEFVIPFEYQVEYLPENKNLETKFGKYCYELKANGNKILFHRRFELNKGDYEQSDFQSFHSFLNSIANNDRERIILRKKGV